MQMLVVAISTKRGFRAGSPEALFDLPAAMTGYSQDHPLFGLSFDPQSFAMVQPVQPAGPTREIGVVHQWFQVLQPEIAIQYSRRQAGTGCAWPP